MIRCGPIFQHIGFICWEVLGFDSRLSVNHVDANFVQGLFFPATKWKENQFARHCHQKPWYLHVSYNLCGQTWRSHQQKIEDRHHKPQKGAEVIRSSGCWVSALSSGGSIFNIVIDHRVQSFSTLCKCTVVSRYILICFYQQNTTQCTSVCRFFCSRTILNISNKSHQVHSTNNSALWTDAARLSKCNFFSKKNVIIKLLT